MSKRAEELAKQLYPDPKLEDYDDILVYRADRDNAIMGRSNVICVYEQAVKDILSKITKEHLDGLKWIERTGITSQPYPYHKYCKDLRKILETLLNDD